VFVGHTTLRATLSVVTVLILSFVLTAAISSAYKRERASLGESHYDRAEWSLQHDRMGDAADEFRQALLFLPENTRYRLSLGTALLDTGHLTEAQTHLEQLLQEDPTNGRINLALARVAVKRANVTGAIDYYQRAVYEYWPASEMPERRKARWELVNLLEETGRDAEVVGELIQLYASAPNDPQERARIGFALLKYGAVSEAAEIFGALERKFPQQEYAHRGLGQADLSRGDYVAARHEFQHALHLDPKDRASAAGLTLTNTVIDLDPVLSGIGSVERLRRSENLLNRVLSDITVCAGTRAWSDQLTEQVDDAVKMLSDKQPHDNDYYLQLQAAAQGLWQNRLSFCGTLAAPDRAAELALAKVRNE
jgi:tetratricopeptide (TPR) repeat protein